MNILITGATSGVGLATATELSKKGHRVIGTTSSLSKYNQDDFSFELIEMDLRKPDQISDFELHLKTFELDILIANAGIGEIGSVEHTTLEATREMFEANYFGHLALFKLSLNSLKKTQGKIIVLGSVVYSLPFPFKAQYSASKSALSSLALSMRQELKPFGIKVHILEPGWIRSNFHNRLKINDPKDSVYNERMKPFLDHSRDKQDKYPDGLRVATIIEKLIIKNSPTRNAVGPDAKLFFALKSYM